MWEENPIYQDANYRLTVKATIVVFLLANLWCVAFRDWEMLGYVWIILASLIAALCAYAAVIWLVGKSILWIANTRRRNR
jgi:hypothetical protein